MKHSRWHWCWLISLLFVAACRTGSKPRPPESDLERTLFFVERDQEQRLYRISAEPLESGTQDVKNVPWDFPVDYESKIEVRLNKSMLRPLVRAVDVPAVDKVLVPRAERLHEMIQVLGELVAARTKAIEQWSALGAAAVNSPEEAAAQKQFSDVLVPLSEAKQRFQKLIEKLYPDEPATIEARTQLEDHYDALMKGPGNTGMRDYLQREIDDLDRSTRKVVSQTQQDFALRLEAFLISADKGKEPVAIHLDGYDSIAEKHVKSTDRFGLALNSVERMRLQSLLASARDVADAANKLNEGTADLSSAFDGATSELARRIDAYLTELEAVIGEWETRTSAAGLKSITDAVPPLIEALKQIVQTELGAERQKLASDLQTKLAAWAAASPLPQALRNTLEKSRQVRDAWKGGSSHVDALTRTTELLTSIGAVVQSLESLQGLVEAAREVVETAKADFVTKKPLLEQQLRDAVDKSDLKKHVDSWRLLLARTRRILAPVKGFVGIVDQTRPVDATLRVPEAIDVDLDDAPNTAIDLTRTESNPGDRVELRATLVENKQAKATTSASFELEKLGWHADLVPAVVLVTADQLAGADDSGGFTASLSWMLRYDPRPDETDFLANSAKWLGWGVGLHATLLNFDRENDAEIGLGVTVGLWGDRLLLGAGMNPLADADDEGRFYYFVGSSLIPLLQAFDSN